MDNSRAGRTVVDATDGVKLSKRFDEAEHDLPAVVYEFTSARSNPVTVSVVEPIPAQLGPDDVGFMGAHGTTAWTIKGPKLVFEADLAPGTEYTTALAGRGEHADAVRALLARPDAFEVQPPARESDAPVTDTPSVADGTFTRGASAGSAAGGESTGESTECAVSGQDSTGTPDASRSDAGHHRDRVVEQFVAELRHGGVSETDREFLRRAFLDDETPRGGVDPTVRELQRDLADVETRLERIEPALEALRDTVGTVEAAVETNDADVDALQTDLSGVEARMDALSGEVGSLTQTIASLSIDVESTAEERPVDDAADRFAALHDDLSLDGSFTDRLRSPFERNK